ncbi:hypothetical protein GCM10009779_64560 [Polymorphospora rubra]|uniref:Uncharacterized protein n=1 Tax=Polymorphospora rubra TaxID=338584 RepID=A0A810MYS1_9ACTN|nr:hypothetical protein Prubr_21300 [Polymorphospora rubra]
MATTDAQPRQTASQRLAAALGRPAPAPLTAEEAAEWERIQDQADAELSELSERYGAVERA